MNEIKDKVGVGVVNAMDKGRDVEKERVVMRVRERQRERKVH
jgi:hypothetical protein